MFCAYEMWDVFSIYSMPSFLILASDFNNILSNDDI